MIQFCNPSIEFLPNTGDILSISNGHRWQKGILSFVEPYRFTVISSLPKTNEVAQYNYEHFTKTMAKIVQKYSDKILN